MSFILSLVSMAAILSMLVPASVLGQGDFKIFVTDNDAIHELDLKATEGQNGQVNQVSGFAIEANSVVQINQNENLQVFTSTNEPERIEKVKVTDHNGQLIELTKSGFEWSSQGFDDGVYLLDVIVNMPDGSKGAFETVLVILAPNSQKVNPTQVIQQVVNVKTDTKLVFRDQKPKPKPSVCYFDPNNKACDPVNGKCPPGFGFNDDDRCIPIGKCPAGYGRLDDDETGTCYPKNDIKSCPDGSVVHVREQCPPLYAPIVCPAGQELSADGLNCAPPCDGSYQDCIYNGHLCKAGSAEHACELPAEGEQALSCQPEDDFCEPGCESLSMDCIDDVNIGDDGEDSTNEEDEEETSNCGGEPCTDTEKEDSTLDDEEESSGDEESASDEGADTGGDEGGDGMFG